MSSPHAVDRAVRQSAAFRAGSRVLVAVSGGPDSMALLAAAAQSPAHVVAAHFDHRIRDNSERDLDTVRVFADAHGIEVIAASDDVPARARAQRVSIETAAREARYAFLRDAAARFSCDWIATAHTQSDQVETVLMRILRGAGERGLSGIARKRDGVARPLLDVTRADTLDYCRAHGIAFVIDPSNEDRRHTRNAVRHDVLPALRLAFPGIDKSLLRVSERAEATLYNARRVTDVRLARLRHENDAWVLPIDAFEGLDEMEASILAGDVLERMHVRDDITTAHFAAALELTREGRVGASADLPGVSVRRDHDALVWRPRGAATHEQRLAAHLTVPGSVELNGWIVTATRNSDAGAASCSTRFPEEGVALGSTRFHEARFQPTRAKCMSGEPSATPTFDSTRFHESRASGAAGDVVCSTRFHEARFQPTRAKCMSGEQATSPWPELTVRAPRPGDRIQPFGMHGHKKLSDVFIDRKVPHRERAHCIVVVADREILWVPGVVTSELTRVSGENSIQITAVRPEVTP